ncbi:F-box protein SKIP23 [Spinacia oleracea]|uniref:F-box protein SKIP23 n=1 Tax=Spinacia oleracea TaxID=3562 RepID=A0ABM3RIA5_SPIOL|nr:F-box protein SKIP23-like [Spinacia oleracea]
MTTRITGRSRCRNRWADLPPELLEKIGEHLQSRIDVFRYRAVCTSWRSTISLSSPSSSTSNFDAFMSPVTICRLEHQNHRSSACLVKVVQTPRGNFEVLNPLTIPKPDFILGKTLNLLEYRLFELAKGLHFDSSFTSDDLNVQKAVVFRDCGVVAIYDFGKLGFRVSGDKKWTELGKAIPRYDDILVYQGEYYVMDRFGMVSLIDKAMNLVKYFPPLNSLASIGKQKNLVESDGNLYVVDTYFGGRNIVDDDGDVIGSKQERVDMKVYKLDEKWGTWVLVNSLDDRIFVLGKDVCFSVSVNDFPGCEGNCIYLIDSSYLEEDLDGYRFDDEEMECTCDSLFRPY